MRKCIGGHIDVGSTKSYPLLDKKFPFILLSQITAVSLENAMYDMEEVTMDMVTTCSIAVLKNTYLAYYLIVSSVDIFISLTI